MKNLTLSHFCIEKAPRDNIVEVLEKAYTATLEQARNEALETKDTIGEIVTWIQITVDEDPNVAILLRTECDVMDPERTTIEALKEISLNQLEDFPKTDFVIINLYHIIAEDKFPEELSRDPFVAANLEKEGKVTRTHHHQWSLDLD